MTVKGIYMNGVIFPQEELNVENGQEVTITVPAEETSEDSGHDQEGGLLTTLITLLEAHEFDGGVPDMAHQHDHYIHGTPKRAD